MPSDGDSSPKGRERDGEKGRRVGEPLYLLLFLDCKRGDESKTVREEMKARRKKD